MLLSLTLLLTWLGLQTNTWCLAGAQPSVVVDRLSRVAQPRGRAYLSEQLPLNQLSQLSANNSQSLSLPLQRPAGSEAERCSGAAGVFMEPQLRARAGDSVLLQCLFLDPDSKGWTLHKVDWLHKAGAGTQEEMVFYYYSNHGVPVGRFKNRVQWQGNMSRWDGSIRLQDTSVNDSGIYECELRLLQNSSIFRSRTVLHVSPAVPRGGGAADAEDAAPPRDSGFWPAVVGCGCVAVVVAFLAGLCVRKRFATNTALERMGKSSSKNRAEEAIYSSIPEAEVPKAEQEAKKKKRAEDTYITMHPSHCRDNGVYVELAKRAIPSEWMAEGTQGSGQSKEPHSRPEEALSWTPEREK